MSDGVPLFRIDWGRPEVQKVVDSVTRGRFWAKGPYIDEFEEKLASYHDVEHALTFNSGTTALVGALEGAGVSDGDEVIVPSFTFIATANAVKLCDAEPVFAEIEPDRYGLDPEDVERKITDQTAAILPVHYGGAPCRIRALRSIADEYDLTLIEDAAEAQGAILDGDKIGSIGDAGILSFCQNKVITTGEGGAVLTDDDDIARQCELLRSHGRESDAYFESTGGGEYIALGNNFRMPDICAALGVGQIIRIEEIIQKRRQIASTFNEQLGAIDGVTVPSEAEEARDVYQLYTIRFNSNLDRDAIAQTLTEAGISCKVYFDPVHLSSFYRESHGFESGDFPETERLSASVLSLPIYPSQTPEETAQIIEGVSDAVQAER